MRHRPFIFLVVLGMLFCGGVSGAKAISQNSASRNIMQGHDGHGGVRYLTDLSAGSSAVLSQLGGVVPGTGASTSGTGSQADQFLQQQFAGGSANWVAQEEQAFWNVVRNVGFLLQGNPYVVSLEMGNYG
jgi:hypothetical protein